MVLLLFALCILYGLVLSVEGSVAEFKPVFGPPVGITKEQREHLRIPYVDGGQVFIHGQIKTYQGKVTNVTSPILDLETNQPIVIGRMAQMTEDDLPSITEAATQAWDDGQGVWPQMTFAGRIAALERAVELLRLRREEIIDILVWEICKSTKDAASEFDRTLQFVAALIAEFRALDQQSLVWRSLEGIYAIVRRAARGIVLCVGPFNYPLNETYATLIPALLMGNVVLLKVPTVGGLAHVLTMRAFLDALPPGTLQFVTGSGRRLLGPLMRSGAVDALAFIGTSKAADELIKAHPKVHRLKVFAQLEGKNMAVVHHDLLASPAALLSPASLLEEAMDQLVVGALSFNGQRCTAVKMIFVHEDLVDAVLQGLERRLAALPTGLPFLPPSSPPSALSGIHITPLPGNRTQYFLSLLQDAVSKGARVVNAGGGEVRGQLLVPALVYPTLPNMRLYSEEQFGPVLPLTSYRSLDEVLAYAKHSEVAQQAALFLTDPASLGPLLSALAQVVGRINLLSPPQRSPDALPFSGRRSSAMGTMSVREALLTFSVEVVVAGKHRGADGVDRAAWMREVGEASGFLAPLDAMAAAPQQEL